MIDQSAMKLVVPMSESNIGKVKLGQPATVTVPALPTQKLAAHVSEHQPAADQQQRRRQLST